MEDSLLTSDQLIARSHIGAGGPSGDGPLLFVDLETLPSDPEVSRRFIAESVSWPVVIAGIGPIASHSGAIGRAVDLVLEPESALIETLRINVSDHSVAATTLAMLLRTTVQLDPHSGLVAESAAYSTLQSGADFMSWRRGRGAPSPARTRDAAVRIEDHGSELHIVLDRPDRHNAIDRQLRLELHDALRVAALAPNETVVLRGDGPSFSSGGDLAEFGSFTDPAAAHLERMHAHPAIAALALNRRRVVARVHGSCLGGGIEIAAFAGHVSARTDSVFQLPELGLGLLPGAGGTVSLTRRIGRQKTALLALTMQRLGAPTALDWGLIDEISSM